MPPKIAQDQYGQPMEEMSEMNPVSSMKIDPNQLKMGILMEKEEHGFDDKISQKIAMDHLKEIPDYYTRLEKMEEEAIGKEGEESKESPELEKSEQESEEEME